MSALDLLPGYVRDRIAAKDDPHLRADLLVIPEAEAAGWVATFRNNSWHNGAGFQRGNTYVWSASAGWRRNTVEQEADGIWRFTRTPETFPDTLAGLREALGLEVTA